jgi:hypothetical protein
MGQAAMLKKRDEFLEKQEARVYDLPRMLQTGNVLPWKEALRKEIKIAFTDEYCLGHGGRGSMTHTDWGRLGGLLRQQYRYLDKFERDILLGKYTDEFGNLRLDAIGSRSQLYMQSSIAAYERGHAYGLGCPRLPAYPGEHVGCRCSWEIETVRDERTVAGWNCYWSTAEDAGVCPICDQHGSEWSPLWVENQVATRH